MACSAERWCTPTRGRDTAILILSLVDFHGTNIQLHQQKRSPAGQRKTADLFFPPSLLYWLVPRAADIASRPHKGSRQWLMDYRYSPA